MNVSPAVCTSFLQQAVEELYNNNHSATRMDKPNILHTYIRLW